MATSDQSPPAPGDGSGPAGFDAAEGNDWGDYVPVSPLRPEDPPKVGPFWLDARLQTSPAGVAFTGHDAQDTPALVVLLSEGAAADSAARDRLAGEVNAMHIDRVSARGGQGQDRGRLGRRFVPADQPVASDGRVDAPWVALTYDGSPTDADTARNLLARVELAGLPPQGRQAGPNYQHYWIDRVRPGLARLWPLPWPGRFDRAGWRTIFVSWLLMLLLAALAVLIAILIFRNQPPQSPPPPTEGTGSPPPASSSPSPQSGSPSPQSGSPSPQSGSPSPSPSNSGSPSPSDSGSPSPSDGQPTPDETATPAGSPTPPSRL